jgi:hypothetical protein
MAARYASCFGDRSLAALDGGAHRLKAVKARPSALKPIEYQSTPHHWTAAGLALLLHAVHAAPILAWHAVM